MAHESVRARLAVVAASIAKRDKRIEDLERKLADERQGRALEAAHHDGLAEALRLSEDDAGPAPTVPQHTPAHQELAKRGGRQVGAITDAWRQRLKHFYDQGTSFHPTAMVELIAAEGGKTNSAEVTRTLKKHLEHGYVVLGPNGTYQVTDYAAQRFDFSSPKMNEGPASTGPSIVSTGPEAGARGGATHLPPEGSIPSGSTSVKEGQVSTPADLHAHNPKGGLLM